jgi:prepilin-type N-terminal cleavage/methylation domain-containing protein
MNRPRPSPRSGFTLVELLMGLALSSMLLAAILSSYLFLGRSLTRLALQQELERQSRGTLVRLAADLRLTQSVTSATDTALALTVPAGTVTYTYNGSTKTLTRTASFGASPTLVLLTGCTAFDFNYFTTADGAPTDQLTPAVFVPLSIKQVEAGFTLAAGTANAGTATKLQAASGRIILRNRQLPTGP